ncbi:hypothetical protein PS689_00716 [Pseudomonas fluorescens]|nr:hypothetical protein PS689_00716 [Pseudomonas fluorescens]
MEFSKPHSDEALRDASRIRDRITGEFSKLNGCDILEFKEALFIDREFFLTAYKPSKWTLLHRFTHSYLEEEWNYSRRKDGDYFNTAAHRILARYDIPFNASHGGDEDPNHRWHLYKLLQRPLRQIAHEVFCILFPDKDLMRKFSLRVADSISDFKPQQHPDFLAAQGCLKRGSYWSRWLEKALFYRENGRCAICTNSLTGVIDPFAKVHIDHIIPISQGGTSDPTNLQILCSTCNLAKGNRNNDSGELIYVPWNLDY